MAGLPLRIAFLWHNHQPYYKKDGEFILPWVRLHAVKDYYDLPLLLNEFPKIRQTINIVPSVILQIKEYLESGVLDSIQRLTKIPASELCFDDKSKIIDLFFICNEKNLIRPNWRFSQLFDKSKEWNALDIFTTQDWLDLQVWYNLSWLGEYSKKNPVAQCLIWKASNFTEEEKNQLLAFHNEIMAGIIPLYKSLQQSGLVEISTTPFYHPILPLLVDTNSAKESNPENESVEPNFSFPEDAERQIEMSIENYNEIFGNPPNGFWPSEGSLSNDVLKIFCKKNVKWVATDESVLFASEQSKTGLEKFFPRKFESDGNEITIFFRDHNLSDKIGFQYSNWLPFDAASNFVQSLIDIRHSIINNYGEESLRHAVVPIILDGENCWEFYPKNGFDFLRSLYEQISDNNELTTILLTDAANDGSNNYLPSLNSIRAGSWIDANFNIWIGSNYDIFAWNMLSKARHLFEQKKSELTNEIAESAYLQLLIAEGSDWFWWYGPEHTAENKPDFDVLFRWYIKNFYELLGEAPPEEVFCPIGNDLNPNFKLPDSKISPGIDFPTNISQWELSGFYIFKQNFSTMHQSSKPDVKILFGNDNDFLYFKIENLKVNSIDNSLQIKIADFGFEVKTDEKNFMVNSELIQPTFNQNYINFKIPLKKLNLVSNNFSISYKMINLAENKLIEKTFEYKLV